MSKTWSVDRLERTDYVQHVMHIYFYLSTPSQLQLKNNYLSLTFVTTTSKKCENLEEFTVTRNNYDKELTRVTLRNINKILNKHKRDILQNNALNILFIAIMSLTRISI